MSGGSLGKIELNWKHARLNNYMQMPVRITSCHFTLIFSWEVMQIILLIVLIHTEFRALKHDVVLYDEIWLWFPVLLKVTRVPGLVWTLTPLTTAKHMVQRTLREVMFMRGVSDSQAIRRLGQEFRIAVSSSGYIVVHKMCWIFPWGLIVKSRLSCCMEYYFDYITPATVFVIFDIALTGVCVFDGTRYMSTQPMDTNNGYKTLSTIYFAK